MQRLTIIADDGMVYVDGVALKVDLASLDPTIHAVQWYGSAGEIEFRTDADGNRKPNERITDASPFLHLVELHQVAAAEVEAARAAAAKPAPSTATQPAAPVNVIAN